MEEQRFVELWIRAGSRAGESKARRLYADLVEYYGQAHRRYHTFEHIRHCLRQVDRIPDDYADRDAVELAIWFHDAIYEIGDPMNERNSEQWFRSQAADDLPEAMVEQVSRLILATEHQRPPEQIDACYVVDIDLSSFGLPHDEFIVDSQLVRDEATHLSDDEFFAGQRKFLGALLQRQRVYQTDLFNRIYEEQARSNIRSTLEKIDRHLG